MTPDDDRLTDELCTKYASDIGDLAPEALTEGDFEEAVATIKWNVLTKLGLISDDEEGPRVCGF